MGVQKVPDGDPLGDMVGPVEEQHLYQPNVLEAALLVLLLFFGISTINKGPFERFELTMFEVRQDNNSVSSNKFAMVAIVCAHKVI